MRVIFLTIFFVLQIFANLTIDDGEVFQLGKDENISISGDLIISQSSVLKANKNCNISLDKDWINDGNFSASTSTVLFKGELFSMVKGENIFYNFISQKDIIFESDKTQEVTHIFRFKNGDISSSIVGVWGILNLAKADVIDLDSLSVEDSKVIGRVEALNPPNSQDNGNTIKWFSKERICQNIGSGYEWFDKLSCDGDITSYVSKNENLTSTISFKTSLEPKITDSSDELTLSYKASADSQDECSHDVIVTLFHDATIKSGFKGCRYEDPTLKNWEKFKNAKVVIKEDKQDNSKSVIVVDLKLTSTLIIGGSNAQ